VQVGHSGHTELITAAPVLTYAGAPDAYLEFGGTWAADPAEWRATPIPDGRQP
jgi:hypothetical protein